MTMSRVILYSSAGLILLGLGWLTLYCGCA